MTDQELGAYLNLAGDAYDAQLGAELVVNEEANAVAGGAIWNDIWDAVSQLNDFLAAGVRIFPWLGGKFIDAIDAVWDAASDLTGVVISWGGVIWNKFGRAAGTVWDWIQTALSSTLGGVINAALYVSGLLGSFPGTVYDWLQTVINTIQGSIVSASGFVQGLIGDARGTVYSWGIANTQSVLGGVVATAGWIQDLIGDAPGTIWDWIQAAGGAVIDFTTDLAVVFGDFLGDAPGTVWDWVIGTGDDVKDKVIEEGDAVMNFVTNTGDSIVESVSNVVVAGGQGIGGFFQSGLEWLFGSVFAPFADALAVKASIPRKLMQGEYNTIEEIMDDFEDPLTPESIVGGLFAMAGMTIALPGVLSEVGAIRSQGVIQQAALDTGRTIPSFNDLRDGLLRGFIPQNIHDLWLGRAGFDEDNIQLINDLYFDLPTTGDLVRMAVREVFSPDVVSQFGLFDEFPAEFGRLGGEIGLSDEVARWQWGAHWDLPSITQGFEMFHRDVIDAPTLGLLLRTQDVMPFWRQKITDIAFRVVSRVDIRRMFRLGVVDRARVERVYLDLGYAPQDAAALTEFVVRDAAGADKDLPRETIERFYRERILARSEASAELLELGFDDEQAGMFLDAVDLTVADQLAKLEERIIEVDFKRGAMLEGTARAALLEAGVPAERVDLVVQLWTRQSAVRDRDLTPSQLLRLFRADILPEASLRDRLARQGYNDQDVGYMIELADPEEGAPEPRELTKADLRKAFEENIIDESELRARLDRKGYAGSDVDILVRLAQPA